MSWQQPVLSVNYNSVQLSAIVTRLPNNVSQFFFGLGIYLSFVAPELPGLPPVCLRLLWVEPDKSQGQSFEKSTDPLQFIVTKLAQ